MATKTSKSTSTARSRSVKTTSKTVKKPSGSCAKCAPQSAGASSATVSDNYAPLSTWGFLGYGFLFAIPVVGWVICVSFALMAHNHNLRHFARSQSIWLAIFLITFLIVVATGGFKAICHAFGLV